MNLTFGWYGDTDSADGGAFDRISELFADESTGGGPTRLQGGDGSGFSYAHGTIDDGGSAMGTASSGSVTLSYHGLFWNRLPGWSSEQTPLDDPAATAAYLLQRFLDHDTAFLDGLPGHFSAVVVDSEAKRVVLGCEGSGMRRLFIHQEGRNLRFASKLAAMAGLLGEQLEVDRGLEDFLLGFEFLPWGRTLFKDVRILPAGSVMDWRQAGEGATVEARDVKKDVFFPERWAETRLGSGDAEQAGEMLHQALQEALDDQMPRAGKVGVLLGGFDSALVAALLKDRGKEVETFSFHFKEAGYDQPLVQETMGALGIRHHWVPITPEVLRDGLERYGRRFHQPASQPHYLVETAEVCRVVRERGITHLFSGDGCDGLFLGYPTVYRRARLIDRLSKIPRPLVSLALWLSAFPPLEPLLGHPYRLGRNVLQILKRKMPERAHIASRIFDGLSLRRLRLDPPPAQEKDVETILTELAQGLEHMNPVRLAYRGKGSVGLNKSKLEGCADAHGIVIQSPYVHPSTAALASKIPDELSRPPADLDAAKQSVGKGKYVLMKMVEDRKLLEPDVIYQAKRSPVHAPVDRWYQNELRDDVLRWMDDLPFRVSKRYVKQLLRPKLAEALYRRHISLGDLALHSVALLSSFSRLTRLARR